MVARQEKVQLPEDIEVHADISIGPPEGSNGFAIAAELHVRSKDIKDRQALEHVTGLAHQACPYSKAMCVETAQT